MRYVALIAVVLILFSFSSPVEAQSFLGPIVPAECRTAPCQACHVIKLADNLIRFAIYAATLIATLMFVYAGFLYLSSAANPENIAKAHKIFFNVVIGFIIVLIAWLLVATLLRVFTGQSDFTPWTNNIKCNVGVNFQPGTVNTGTDIPGSSGDPGGIVEGDVGTSEMPAGATCVPDGFDGDGKCVEWSLPGETPPSTPNTTGQYSESASDPELASSGELRIPTVSTQCVGVRDGGQYCKFTEETVQRSTDFYKELQDEGIEMKVSGGVGGTHQANCQKLGNTETGTCYDAVFQSNNQAYADCMNNPTCIQKINQTATKYGLKSVFEYDSSAIAVVKSRPGAEKLVEGPTGDITVARGTETHASVYVWRPGITQTFSRTAERSR